MEIPATAYNWLFDHVLPRADPYTFKVVAAVTRATAGWHVAEARLTLAELQTLTGMRSRGTLCRSVADALAEGYISRRPAGASFLYRLVVQRCPAGRPRSSGRTAAAPPPVPPGDRSRSSQRTAHSLNSGPPSINKRKRERKGKERVPPGGGERQPSRLPAIVGENHPAGAA